MNKTKKEQGWQNSPAVGAYSLKPAKIEAEMPEHLKNKEKEKQIRLKRKKDAEKVPMQPFVAGYNGGKPRRTEDGGILRLKRREK